MGYSEAYLKRLAEIEKPFDEAKKSVFKAHELLWKEYERIEALKHAAIRDLMHQMGVENKAVSLIKSGRTIYYYYWNDGYDQSENYGFRRFYDKEPDNMTSEIEAAVIEALELGLIEKGENLYPDSDERTEYLLQLVKYEK